MKRSQPGPKTTNRPNQVRNTPRNFRARFHKSKTSTQRSSTVVTISPMSHRVSRRLTLKSQMQTRRKTQRNPYKASADARPSPGPATTDSNRGHQSEPGSRAEMDST